MKKYLLSEKGNFYKVNLHCHTTVSDGEKTPEEVKEIYKSHGYSAVAFTDHNVIVRHDELTDDSFVALHGMEAEVYSKIDEFGRQKCCHICFVSEDPDCKRQPFNYHSTGEEPKNKENLLYDPDKDEMFDRVYTPECISEMMRLGSEHGFFVTYNHPTWSGEDYPDYSQYNGMNAMEVANSDCQCGGYPEYNERQYDDLLRCGKRIFCIAADDNHNNFPEGHVRCSSCKAYVMIKADHLDYQCLMENLKKGNFYSSQGPEIHELWFEDGNLHVTCSPADKIVMSAHRRRRAAVIDTVGTGVTEAKFYVNPSDGYVRITVTGKDGKMAHTNAYFTDELLKE